MNNNWKSKNRHKFLLQYKVLKRVFYGGRKVKNKALQLIDIQFLYNGNLGILQQKTIDNKQVCNNLLQSKIITYEEYTEALKAICDYFLEQIQKVAENPLHYTNW